MGSVLYDFLSENLLFDERLLATDFEHVAESELTRELRRYHDYCVAYFEQIVGEVPDGGGTNLFLARAPTIDELRQTTLYVPCHAGFRIGEGDAAMRYLNMRIAGGRG